MRRASLGGALTLAGAGTTPPAPPIENGHVHLPCATARAIPTRRARRGSWRRHRFAYAMIAPAVVFMVAVHLIPTAAGLPELPAAEHVHVRGALPRAVDRASELPRRALRRAEPAARWVHERRAQHGRLHGVDGRPDAGRRDGDRGAAEPRVPVKRTVRTLMIAPWVVPSFVVAILWQFMWISDTGIINTVLVDWTRAGRQAGLATRPELALGDHHPVGLASAAVRDLDFLQGCKLYPMSCTRPRRSTARTRGSASVASPCR